MDSINPTNSIIQRRNDGPRGSGGGGGVLLLVSSKHPEDKGRELSQRVPQRLCEAIITYPENTYEISHGPRKCFLTICSYHKKQVSAILSGNITSVFYHYITGF